ncbi:Neuroligin-4, Y-linked [Dufourea novaeangliae]|uniref:Neuroligin-4, Y-linked n=1 Tax=Dufourea novaeangliae TaxID=178035 RepID=A0A154PQ88_DUFNO|nr:Neuroligin-4, Y-linked [Dufourea novaeangliae]
MTSPILALFGLVLATASAELSSRIVKTKYGELSGVIVTLERHFDRQFDRQPDRQLDRQLEGVEVFRGVPYASPPIGSLRFMPPVSGALWHGVKVADKFGPVCPQRLPELSDKMPKGRVQYLRRLLPYLRNQSEDCLYLNIYAPVQANKSYTLVPSNPTAAVAATSPPSVSSVLALDREQSLKKTFHGQWTSE